MAKKKKNKQSVVNSCATNSTPNKHGREYWSHPYSNPEIDKLFHDFEKEIEEYISKKANELLGGGNNLSKKP